MTELTIKDLEDENKRNELLMRINTDKAFKERVVYATVKGGIKKISYNDRLKMIFVYNETTLESEHVSTNDKEVWNKFLTTDIIDQLSKREQCKRIVIVEKPNNMKMITISCTCKNDVCS